MDLQKVLQARLFVNGNYAALLILGAQGDWEASDEVQAKFAAEEAAKVDEVWRGIFGSADNGITIPEEDGSNNNGGFLICPTMKVTTIRCLAANYGFLQPDIFTMLSAAVSAGVFPCPTGMAQRYTVSVQPVVLRMG